MISFLGGLHIEISPDGVATQQSLFTASKEIMGE